MTYAFTQDVPANAEIYRLIKDRLGETPPPGMIAHLAIVHDGGLRYIDVWQTEESWIDFRDRCVEPAVGAVLDSFGIPHDHSTVVIQPIEVVDAWLGEPALR